MSHRNRLPVLALMLLVLVLLFGGCGTAPPRLVAVQAPVPPLPQEARQPETPPWCQPTCSAALARLLDGLLKPQTPAGQPDKPVSERIAR